MCEWSQMTKSIGTKRSMVAKDNGMQTWEVGNGDYRLSSWDDGIILELDCDDVWATVKGQFYGMWIRA